MTVGEKIRKYRTQKGLSQKELAMASKMSEPAIRNYELGNRNPSKKHLEAISAALGVSIFAISDPDLDSEHGVMHSLFALEDTYGFKINKDGPEISIVCKDISFLSRLSDWGDMFNKFKNGDITKEEYDEWRDTYPEKAVVNKR